MKEKAISKIQTFGKVGNVISKIAMVLMGIFAVVAIGSMIFCLSVPKDLLEIRIGNTINVKTNFQKFGKMIPKSEQDKLEQNFLKDYNMQEFSINSTIFDMQQVEVEDTSLTISGTAADTVYGSRDLAVLAGIAALMVSGTFVMFFFISKFCKELNKADSPFTEPVLKKMNAAAISIVPWLVIWNFSGTIVEAVLSNSRNLSFSLNIGMILTILMIFGMVTIFKYGAMLQQESDETL